MVSPRSFVLALIPPSNRCTSRLPNVTNSQHRLLSAAFALGFAIALG